MEFYILTANLAAIFEFKAVSACMPHADRMSNIGRLHAATPAPTYNTHAAQCGQVRQANMSQVISIMPASVCKIMLNVDKPLGVTQWTYQQHGTRVRQTPRQERGGRGGWRGARRVEANNTRHTEAVWSASKVDKLLSLLGRSPVLPDICSYS